MLNTLPKLPKPSATDRKPYLRMLFWMIIPLLFLGYIFLNVTGFFQQDNQPSAVMAPEAIAARSQEDAPSPTLQGTAGEDPFDTWYRTEFRPWAQKVDRTCTSPTPATNSARSLWLAIASLIVLQLLTWTALARKKDKEP